MATTRISMVPSQADRTGGFGSITWANEPPSEAEREQVKFERMLMRSILENDTEQFTRILSQYGNIVNVNFESSGKMTLLHAAMALGRLEMATVLVSKRGANVNAKNSLGFTPLISAVQNGHEQCVQLALRAGATKTEKTMKGETAIEIAKRKGFKSIVDLLS